MSATTMKRIGSVLAMVGLAVGVGLVLGGVTGITVTPWLLLAVARLVRRLG